MRNAKLWFGICLLAILGTAVWLSLDLSGFIQERGVSGGVGLRVLYNFVSEVDTPALQIILGSFLAAIFSWRASKTAVAKLESPASKDEEPSSNPIATA